jgi:UDP-N-acetylmuramoylalanine--D-glutamate ligase
MEFVAASGGRRFVDDSKATNIAAMAAALKNSPGKARLIAGGILKEFDAGKIKELLEIKVKSAYVLGKDAGVLISSWQDTIPCTKCVSMEQAVRLAWQDSDKGDTILLSPGAASFDSYSGFEERGKDFKEQVLKVIEEES